MDFINTKTKVVVVTYGNRWSLLSKTLNSVLKFEEVDEVVVVQNGNSYDLSSKLEELSKVTLIKKNKNTGSAGGFWTGLNYLDSKNINNFNILILDDDNLLDADVFNQLKKVEKLHKYNEKHIWSLFRPNVQGDYIFEESLEKSKASFANTINGFTFIHIFNKHYRYKKKKYNDLVKVITSPYSGLIFPAKMLSDVGLPNRNFYLYSDDIDFTFRISEAGYDILKYKNAKAFDQGIAWQVLNDKKDKNRGAFFLTNDIYRPLYMYRNELYISYNRFRNNNFIFWINYYLLQIWMIVDYMPKNKDGINKFLLLKRAMRQGVHGSLGKSLWIEKTKEKSNDC